MFFPLPENQIHYENCLRDTNGIPKLKTDGFVLLRLETQGADGAGGEIQALFKSDHPKSAH